MDVEFLSMKCEDANKYNLSERCDLVKNLSDCQSANGFLNYVIIEFCDFNGTMVQPMILYALWVSFLFVVLGITTDNFFCPSLSVISKALGLSDNVAGVTFLALGNGAPDIFSSLAAVNQDRPEFVIGGLFGAGIFVTCVVAGSIMIVTPFSINGLPFLRDIIFYLGASFWAFCMFYQEEVSLLDSLGFISMYVVYISVVVLFPRIYGIWNKSPVKTGFTHESCETNFADSSNRDQLDAVITNGDISTRIHNVVSINADDDIVDESTPLLANIGQVSTKRGIVKKFFYAVSPIDTTKYSAASWTIKAFLILQSPAIFCLKLTVPVIDYEEEKNNWNKLLNALHCVVGPLFAMFVTQNAFLSIYNECPVWAVVLALGTLLSLLVFCTSTFDAPPKYHSAFAFLGFSIAIVWIYVMANEIVNILKAIGVALNIPGAILGLTVLAWGNSIGDFVANFAVARRGAPLMGISACFGGPLLNLLIGMGIPFTIEIVTESKPIKVSYDQTVQIMSIVLLTSLVSTMVAMVVLKFHANRRYGFYLLFLYFAFVVVAVLETLNVI